MRIQAQAHSTCSTVQSCASKSTWLPAPDTQAEHRLQLKLSGTVCAFVSKNLRALIRKHEYCTITSSAAAGSRGSRYNLNLKGNLWIS